MQGKCSTSSVKCSDKLQKATDDIALGDKACLIGNRITMTSRGRGSKNNTPQHSCTSLVGDAFYNFENDIQRIVDNDPNCERSLKI